MNPETALGGMDFSLSSFLSLFCYFFLFLSYFLLLTLSLPLSVPGFSLDGVRVLSLSQKRDSHPLSLSLYADRSYTHLRKGTSLSTTCG